MKRIDCGAKSEGLPLDNALSKAVKIIKSNQGNDEVIEMAVWRAITESVLHTKSECLNQVISAETAVGEYMAIVEKIDVAVPTSSISTDLISSPQSARNIK